MLRFSLEKATFFKIVGLNLYLDFMFEEFLGLWLDLD